MPDDAATKQHILLVEDDEILRRMYQFSFERHGYSMTLAATGPEGLKMARDSRPDAILLDIMIPDINGLAVLDKLKQDPATQNIPVIVLSNLNSDEYLTKAKAKGAALYIIKSDHEPAEILKMVASVIAHPN